MSIVFYLRLQHFSSMAATVPSPKNFSVTVLKNLRTVSIFLFKYSPKNNISRPHISACFSKDNSPKKN